MPVLFFAMVLPVIEKAEVRFSRLAIGPQFRRRNRPVATRSWVFLGQTGKNRQAGAFPACPKGGDGLPCVRYLPRRSACRGSVRFAREAGGGFVFQTFPDLVISLDLTKIIAFDAYRELPVASNPMLRTGSGPGRIMRSHGKSSGLA